MSAIVAAALGWVFLAFAAISAFQFFEAPTRATRRASAAASAGLSAEQYTRLLRMGELVQGVSSLAAGLTILSLPLFFAVTHNFQITSAMMVFFLSRVAVQTLVETLGQSRGYIYDLALVSKFANRKRN